MNKNFFKFFILAFFIIIADRLLKIFAKQACFAFFCMKLSKNPGAAFGILPGARIFLIIISIVVLFLILIFFRKTKSSLMKTALAMIAAGTISNLIDRIAFGYVIDMIRFSFWPQFPAFNLADVSNTVGALMLVIALLKSAK